MAGAGVSQELSRHGIGASEAAAVLGASPYCTPLDLWLRKRAELAGERRDIPDNEPMKWGRYLEQPIRQAYADRFGVIVATPGASMFHSEHDWRRATPDGLVYRAHAAPAGTVHAVERGVEIKTASHRVAHLWGPDGSDEVPDGYAIQCLWSMHVLDVDVWDLAVLIGGSDFRCYRLERDREWESIVLVPAVEEFWRHNVLGNVEPTIDGSESFKQYLIGKWPGTGETLVADVDTEALVAEIKARRTELRVLEADLALDENLLRQRLGDAAMLESALGRIICKPRLGRALTDWEAVARLLADEASVSLEPLVAAHTKRARPSRPLLYPRTWSASADEQE